MKSRFHSVGETFYIEGYNDISPFSDFFPALAGVGGKPMWVFFTNRGQGIACFGVNNRDGAMLEFLPANKAYQSTPLLGFRTFIKILSPTPHFYEPFQQGDSQAHQTMAVRPWDLELIERHSKLGLEVQVAYYGVPNENVAALARSLTIKNTSNRRVSLKILDGLPRLVPYGMGDYVVKHMSRTVEAFAEVLGLESGVPFFKLKIEPQDRPEFIPIKKGFFSFGVLEKEYVPVVVDPSLVFGQNSVFLKPFEFVNKKNISLRKQLTSNIMPSSLFTADISLKPHESRTIHFYYGCGDNWEAAQLFGANVRASIDFFNSKRLEMSKVYHDLVGHFGFRSDNETLNNYARVTFMDNVLRGGFPLSMDSKGPVVHVFSRKHGDMERDYNAFQVSASYYSQGNGNFRDINQNRRNDLYLNPESGTKNIETFFNALQLDGYNPLNINPVRFSIPRDLFNRLDLKVTDSCKAEFHHLLKEPATMGELYEFVKTYSEDPMDVVNQFRELIRYSTPHQYWQHADGYWIDHWTYNLDLIDQYLAVFPDKKTWLFFEKKDFVYFDSEYVVQPRREKYMITKDGKLKQQNAVVVNSNKKALLASRASDVHKVRVNNGSGAIFTCDFFTKLLSLTAIKASTLDPFGVGLEMEADKPGWCDALNGCPAIFGSSSHEIFELNRLVRFLLEEALPLFPNKTYDVFHELYALIRDIEEALELDDGKDFRAVWDKLAAAREVYRERTLMGVSGKVRNIKVSDIRTFLMRVNQILNRAERRSIDPKTSLPTSYFVYEVDTTEFDDGWRQFMGKMNWRQRRVVPFLEGAVHAFRSATAAQAKKIYSAVRRSELYDPVLKMYKINSPVDEVEVELGRIQIFSKGWLENESIFLHMHYKFLLEILRADMVDLFFKEANGGGLIPFRSADSYGRPNFENCSFLASSAFPDSSYHGRGFVARLSGATSEFLSMIYLLAFGKKPFQLQSAGVVFHPTPALPRDWFSKTETDGYPKNSFSIKIFGVPVLYINSSRRNTFGRGGVKPVGFEWILDGRFYNHKDHSMTPEATQALREARIESLTIFLA